MVKIIKKKYEGNEKLTTDATQVNISINKTIKKIMDMMEVEQDDSNLK